MEKAQLDQVALPEGTVLKGNKIYTIEEAKGAGGFGITYRATWTMTDGNIEHDFPVAVKEHFISSLCERHDTEVVYSRPVKQQVEGSLKDFISEAKRLQKVGVSHPNIVKVNEVFEANNTAYYIMEYLEGESLQSYVRSRGHLTEEQTRAIMMPVIEAVGALHKAYVTHLDIKPANIMITRRKDGSLRPVLIDFGLAKHYDDNGTPTSSINTLGCSEGYSPIEQYAGIRKFSPTADIYALGATMYFCLTGAAPEIATSISRKDIEAALPKDISQMMRSAIIAAMAKDKDDRTKSAAALLAMMGGKMPAAPVVDSKPAEPFDRQTEVIAAKPRKSGRKSPMPLIVIGTMVVVGIAAFFLLRGCRGEAVPEVMDSVEVADTAVVAAPEPAPVAEPVKDEPKEESPDYKGFDYKSLSKLENLALACTRDGEYYYFSQANWKKIPETEKLKFKKRGVAVIGKRESFILDLHDSGCGMSWNVAISRYDNRLPTKAQAIVMADNYEAINSAMSAFGGDAPNHYWTSKESDSWEGSSNSIDLATGKMNIPNKSSSLGVRPVYAISNHINSNNIVSVDYNRLSRLEDLALVCLTNGKYYYFSQENWTKISIKQKAQFTKIGIVVFGEGERFILKLHDNKTKITWDDAMRLYGNKIPNKSQANAILSKYEKINNAITFFGGDRDPEFFYWTNAESNHDSSCALVMDMEEGILLGSYTKINLFRVREILPFQKVAK